MTEEGLRQVFKKMLGTTGDRISRKHAIENLDKTIAELKSKWDSPTESVYQRGINAGLTLAIQALDSETKTHKCSFGFGNGRHFSKKLGDWVCSCGKTRREYLSENEALNSKKEDK